MSGAKKILIYQRKYMRYGGFILTNEFTKLQKICSKNTCYQHYKVEMEPNLPKNIFFKRTSFLKTEHLNVRKINS